MESLLADAVQVIAELLAAGKPALAAAVHHVMDDPEQLAELLGGGTETATESILREHGFTGTDKRGVKWVDGTPQKRADDAGGNGEHNEAHAKDIPDATASALATEFPDAAKDPTVWGKVKAFVATINERVGTFLLNHEKTIGAVAAILDAAMTTPDDIAKNPALAGKFGSHGDVSGDAATAATKDMLGVGIPPTVLAKAAATVIFKAWGLAKRALGITSQQAEGDAMGMAVEFLTGLLEAAGLDVDADTVRAILTPQE